jgi:hypothetical protein
MYRTSNTLSENIRFKSAELLNRHLAAAIDLHAQVKQAHWNVRGPAFIAIHELFDSRGGGRGLFGYDRRTFGGSRQHGRRHDPGGPSSGHSSSATSSGSPTKSRTSQP